VGARNVVGDPLAATYDKGAIEPVQALTAAR
jgi:hypothetical protein